MSDQAGGEVTSSFNQSSGTNQTKAKSSTNCEQVDTSAHPFFMVVYSLVFLVGLLLNGFIMKFYCCQAQQKRSSSMVVYLKNLAAADFLLCLCLPIRIVKYASRSITLHLVNCNFGAFALFLNMYTSIMFMSYIAANRYLKIVQPLGTHILQTVRAAHIISTVTWVFLLAVVGTFVILSLQTQEPLTFVPVRCQIIRSSQLTMLYKIIHITTSTMFLIVLISMVFFYYSTSRRVSLAQQSRPATTSSTKLAKSRRNILVLVSVFCFCFVPYHLVLIPKALLWSYCSWSKVLYYLLELTTVMAALNICLDPLIYFILCKSFRSHLKLGVVRGN